MSDLYILCNSVNRYVLRIMILIMIFIRMCDNLLLLIMTTIQNTKTLWTWGEGANLPSARTETGLPSAVKLEKWHIGECWSEWQGTANFFERWQLNLMPFHPHTSNLLEDFLECHIVKFGTYLPKYRKNLLSAYLESTNCNLKTGAANNTRQHGVTAEKTVILIVTAVRSLYPFWSVTTTSGLCFDDSDCRSLQSSSCFIVDSLEGPARATKAIRPVKTPWDACQVRDKLTRNRP